MRNFRRQRRQTTCRSCSTIVPHVLADLRVLQIKTEGIAPLHKHSYSGGGDDRNSGRCCRKGSEGVFDEGDYRQGEDERVTLSRRPETWYVTYESLYFERS